MTFLLVPILVTRKALLVKPCSLSLAHYSPSYEHKSKPLFAIPFSPKSIKTRRTMRYRIRQGWSDGPSPVYPRFDSTPAGLFLSYQGAELVDALALPRLLGSYVSSIIVRLWIRKQSGYSFAIDRIRGQMNTFRLGQCLRERKTQLLSRWNSKGFNLLVRWGKKKGVRSEQPNYLGPNISPLKEKVESRR